VIRLFAVTALSTALSTLSLLVLVPATASAAPRWAPSASATIRPGAALLTKLDAHSGNACTADFVFTARGATYLGMAAHCAGTGSRAAGSGCTAPTLPVGTDVLVRRSDGGTSRASLAYSSWITMRQRGERDQQRCAYNDFALIALAPADTARVNPTVPVLGGPTGLDTGGLREGEPVSSYAPNDRGTAVKTGTSLGDAANGQLHYVATAPPGVPGDSGSGFLDAHGAAFGVLSTEFDDAEHSNGVIDLAAALAYASRYGPLGPVSLVPGDEPFVGVSL
jgi:hypothetical protein